MGREGDVARNSHVAFPRGFPIGPSRPDPGAARGENRTAAPGEVPTASGKAFAWRNIYFSRGFRNLRPRAGLGARAHLPARARRGFPPRSAPLARDGGLRSERARQLERDPEMVARADGPRRLRRPRARDPGGGPRVVPRGGGERDGGRDQAHARHHRGDIVQASRAPRRRGARRARRARRGARRPRLLRGQRRGPPHHRRAPTARGRARVAAREAPRGGRGDPRDDGAEPPEGAGERPRVRRRRAAHRHGEGRGRRPGALRRRRGRGATKPSSSPASSEPVDPIRTRLSRAARRRSSR